MVETHTYIYIYEYFLHKHQCFLRRSQAKNLIGICTDANVGPCTVTSKLNRDWLECEPMENECNRGQGTGKKSQGCILSDFIYEVIKNGLFFGNVWIPNFGKGMT